MTVIWLDKTAMSLITVWLLGCIDLLTQLFITKHVQYVVVVQL